MVHGNYDCPASFAIQDTLQPDRLSDLAHERELVNAGIKDDGRFSIGKFEWKKILNRVMDFREDQGISKEEFQDNWIRTVVKINFNSVAFLILERNTSQLST